MTSSLLEHPLIQKYFKPDFRAYYPVMDKTHQMDAEAWDRCAMAYRILQAMEEHLNSGDKILIWESKGPFSDANWYEETWKGDMGGFHSCILRLPPQFQPERQKKCEPFMVKCESCGYEASIHMPKQGDTAKFNITKPPSTKCCEDKEYAACFCACHNIEEQFMNAAKETGEWVAKKFCQHARKQPDICQCAGREHEKECLLGKPDRVEQKIDDIVLMSKTKAVDYFRAKLRELVALVRGEKK